MSSKSVIVKSKPKTKSKRSGLIFPVGRVHKILKGGNFAPKIGCGASIYLTALLEYLSAEILELAAQAATDNKLKRIKPRHVLLAIRNDDELDLMLSGVVISEGGVMPSINSVLLPKQTAKTRSE